MHAGEPGNAFDLLLRGVRFTESNIAGDGIGEQERRLIDYRQLARQLSSCSRVRGTS